MRPSLVLLAMLPFATLLRAQQEPAGSNNPDAGARMQAIRERQQQIITTWQQEVANAKQAGEAAGADKPVPALSMRPDFSPLVGDALAAAKDFAGTDDAVDFLLMAMQMGSDKVVGRECLQKLVQDHKDSGKLAKAGRMFGYFAQMVDAGSAAEALPVLITSKNVDVRGWALLATHKEVIEKGDRDGKAYLDARNVLLAAAAEAADKDLGSEIRTTIDVREKYGVGNIAPDIEGQDLDGVVFKLSDYKGKVIFLDFWGDW